MPRDDLAYADDAAVAAQPTSHDQDGDEAVLVDALTIAWSAGHLYEDPRVNEAFRRAVEVLRSAPRSPWAVTVAPGTFRSESGPIRSRREAATRLANALFGHGVAAIGIVRPPSPDDVLALLRIVDAEPDEGEDAPGALVEAGVTSIVLSHQPILMPGDDAEIAEGSGTAPPKWVVAERSGPEAFVERLVAEADPEGAAQRFLAEFAGTLELVDEEDPWGREEVVHAFVDAFFHLPTDFQGRVFEAFLQQRERPECLLFLDQFGGSEIGSIAARLDPAAHPLLREYVRVAAGQDAEQRRAEIAEMLVEGGQSPQEMVIERIAAALTSDDAETPAHVTSVQRIRRRLPTRRDHARAGVNVLRGLLAVTDDAAAFHRLARSWADLVAQAVRARDAKAAGSWIAAASDDHSDDRARTLNRMLTTHIDRDFVEGLTEILTGRSPAADEVRKAAPHFAMDALVKRLGEEEDRSKRRILIEALVAVASVDARPMLKHLDDDRWFVVRNIVVILGRAGHPETAGRVTDVLHHREARVRREALRTLFALLGDESVPELIGALDDESHSVRRQALFLLRTPPDPVVDDALAKAIKSDLPIGERLKIIEVLAARGTESARKVLRRHASVQLALSSTTRTLRAAARRALVTPP